MCLLYVGLSGLVEIIFCLIYMWVLIFCRLSIWLCIGYSYGPCFSWRISGSLWLLGATDFWWPHGTSISRLLDGDILVDFRMNSHLLLLLFSWLVDTCLNLSWFMIVILGIFKLRNKSLWLGSSREDTPLPSHCDRCWSPPISLSGVGHTLAMILWGHV
jgi:hypothetical protein